MSINIKGNATGNNIIEGNVKGDVINNFQSRNPIDKINFDFEKLVGELAKLREYMRSEAKTPKQFETLAKISEAEEAAKQNDKSGVSDNLKSAGLWALELATKIGLQVTGEYIKTLLK
jgi:hypothetical protein